ELPGDDDDDDPQREPGRTEPVHLAQPEHREDLVDRTDLRRTEDVLEQKPDDERGDDSGREHQGSEYVAAGAAAMQDDRRRSPPTLFVTMVTNAMTRVRTAASPERSRKAAM